MDDREVVTAIAAGDPAGIAVAYDRYAAPLYGYCHWALRQPADASEALRDTFVIAAATLGDLPEAPKLRPWLYAVARNECQRRLRKTPAAHATKTAEADRRSDAGERAAAAHQPADAADGPTEVMQPFRATREAPGAADQSTDATLIFPAIRQPTDAADGPTEVMQPFRATREAPGAADQSTDATLTFRAIRQPTDLADRMTGVNGDPEQADLAKMVCAILHELKPRESEVIELNLRHDLNDTDLATALGMSSSNAQALASRALSQVEDAFAALLIMRTGREACPELNALLANSGGLLTEQTRAQVSRHIEQCTTCASRKSGALRPTAISELLPLAELPPGLREQILPMCSSTTANSVAYRRRPVRRAQSTRPRRFLPTTKRLIWRRTEGNPRAATIALTLWIAALWVVSITLLIFTGHHSTHASTARPSMRIPSSSPAAADTTTIPRATPTSASASPSSAVSPSRTYEPRPSASPTVRTEPSPSKSPKASKSVSPSPSRSASRPPSRSPSPSPSPSQSSSAP